VAAAERAAPVSAAEAKTLFAGLGSAPALVLAISGGPDSTALLVLAARWRATLKRGPDLLAVTVDHGLRPAAAREARAVKQLARGLGIRHRTVRWIGRKPKTGLQEAARAVRYRLLAAAARAAGAGHILTGHTLDDQAETVLLRMARGSGPTGLCAMTRESRLEDLALLRPLLDLPKTRLIATLESAGVSFVEDPSNRDPRFTRTRWRELMPALAGEGLDAARLALLARRLRRAEATIEMAVDVAAAAVSDMPWPDRGIIRFDAGKFTGLPAEVALRLIGRAIAWIGAEGAVRLGRLEALYDALAAARSAAAGFERVRRTLAGAMVTLAGDRLTVEPAPPRSRRAKRRRNTLTTPEYGNPRMPKER
jgi:tRNA(Ile)-lysidine synthase